MFISDLAISRPILTIVVMVALVVFGLFALFRLETDELPDIEAPVVQLAIAYPGASPETVEREVVDRIENQIQGISGVDKIESTSLDGFALIAGMVPVALGIGEAADFRAPLGRAVVGGVITSTLLTLLVVPTVYEILDAWHAAILDWFRRHRTHERAPHPQPEPGD
jgi:multidrug efflux pump subunit AcrB